MRRGNIKKNDATTKITTEQSDGKYDPINKAKALAPMRSTISTWITWKARRKRKKNEKEGSELRRR